MSACRKAYEAFPNLAAHNVPQSLIPALIGNELRHYKPFFDSSQDSSVQSTGTVKDFAGNERLAASIGPAQIQLGNIARLVNNYPQLELYKESPARAALDDSKAPFFVAAYLDEAINKLRSKNITPTADALAYMYNPDVRGQRGSNGNIVAPYIQSSKLDALLTAHHFNSFVTADYPNSEILKKSKHVKNIREAMNIVEQTR